MRGIVPLATFSTREKAVVHPHSSDGADEVRG